MELIQYIFIGAGLCIAVPILFMTAAFILGVILELWIKIVEGIL